MDVVPLVRSLYQDYGVVFAQYCHHFIDSLLWTETYIYAYISAFLVFWSVCVIFYKKWMRQRNNALGASMSSTTVGTGDMRLRFRKRDKMLFYGRRMLRKVKNVSGQMYGGQGRKRRAVMRFAKRILHLRRETMPAQMKTVEPPAEYLEETMEGSDRVPPDAVYMLQSIRIFGHFEKPIFLELCKHTEMQYLEAGDYLFNISEPDDSVFIVQSGLINVCISNLDGSTLTLKTVKKGESVTSLLSFINVLAEYPSYYKSVTARAVEKSVVIRLPMQAFKDVFNENPDIMIRVIQVIMVRLERVLITVLRKYLGLNSELVQNHMRPRKSIANMQQQQQQHKASPIHRRSQGENIQHTLSDIRHPMPPDMLIDLSTDFISFNNQQAIDSKLVRATGVENIAKELGLSENDRELIEPYVQIREVESGETLVTEGNADDVCLWFVITGNLVVYQHTFKQLRGPKSDKIDNYIHHVHPGEIVGGMAVLTGEASPFTIKSKVFSRIAFIRRPDVYNIMRERPNIVLDIGNGVVRRLSPLVRQCDYALDWIILESGRALFRQDEMSDSTYIVLSGRLRSIITHSNGKKKIAGEYGKGDLVGIVEMITETCRTSTVLAVRDSELARLPEGLFNAIKLRYPVVVTKLISLLSHRMLGSMQTCDSSTTPLDANPVTHKYSTVALVPITDDVPLTALTYELYHSLCAIGPTLRLTSEVVRKQLGAQIFDANNEYRLTSWLAQQEDRNIITLYQCDTILSPWTKRCMRQSDVVLIIGLGDVSPVVGKFEREIDRIAMRTQKELVLLYSEASNTKPSNTLQWLNVRPWVTRHHHIQCAKRIFTRKSQFRLNDLYSRVLMSEPNMHSDLSRLARWLSGNSIGVVLGGGGARGAAHIGMLKAIQESGIPIDMVGGVSIGALMGALWCADRNITTVTQKAREWCKQMTNWFLQLLDLTYPITSMFSGKEFNKTIRNTLGEVSIEDLWIPYFTLTTDITSSCHRIHTNGSLWRFVRSSMSLSGYIPPLCDPKDGHLLLDGGYVNNLPADVMHNLGAAHIIAIDVGSQDDTDLTNYGDNLSGWWLLYKKWNPFTTPVKVPDLPDIQSRLAYVSCVRQLAEVKKSDYCEYIRPPIDKYKTLAFGSFDEIRDVGYVFGKNYFENMAKAGRMGRFKKWFRHEPPKRHNHSTLSEYTFIDLAEIVCKRPETYVEIDHNHIYSLSDDEDYDGYISEPSTYNRNRKMRVNANSASLSLSENEMDSDIELDLKFSTTKMKLKKDAMVLDSLSPDSNHETERLSDNEDATKPAVMPPIAVDQPTLPDQTDATAARESAQENNNEESTEPQ